MEKSSISIARKCNDIIHGKDVATQQAQAIMRRRGTETKGSTANASSDEKLVVWTLSNDLIDFGKRFQEQTGVEVDTVVIEPADYPTKVQTALLAGEKEPDIIVGEPKMLEDFF